MPALPERVAAVSSDLPSLPEGAAVAQPLAFVPPANSRPAAVPSSSRRAGSAARRAQTAFVANTQVTKQGPAAQSAQTQQTKILMQSVTALATETSEEVVEEAVKASGMWAATAGYLRLAVLCAAALACESRGMDKIAKVLWRLVDVETMRIAVGK